MSFVLGLVVGVAVGHYGVQKIVDWVKAKWSNDAPPPSA